MSSVASFIIGHNMDYDNDNGRLLMVLLLPFILSFLIQDNVINKKVVQVLLLNVAYLVYLHTAEI